MRARTVLTAGVLGLGVALASPAVASAAPLAAPLAPGSGNHPELQDRGPKQCGPGRHLAGDGWTCLPDRPVRHLIHRKLPIGQDGTAQKIAVGGEVILFGMVLVVMI